MNTLDKDIHVVGLSIITTNELAKNENEIGKLWMDFFNRPIKEKLNNIVSASIFAVYSDYENEYKARYRVTIGYALNDGAQVPEGLSLVTIPAGKYQAYKAKSRAPEDIVGVWSEIWASDPKFLQRNYVADFEEYQGNEVTINIGCA